LLAGLIDSGGYMSNSCFEYATTSKTLAEDIAYVARSLGFAAYISETKKSCTYLEEIKTSDVWRVTISGNTDDIPVILDRRKCNARKQTKDVLKSAITIEDIGEGEYFGFEISGDGLFLLGDFTVTHNTAIVKSAFSRNFGHEEDILGEDGKPTGNKKFVPGILNRDWLYFSSATLDPWVDLIGVPRKVMKIINGEKIECLELVRPAWQLRGNIQGLFFDELNRSHKKVRNAVMELIQFGSINGHVIEGLRCVWGAINPHDDEQGKYDVEELDDAFVDRFQAQVDFPYKPNEQYLSEVHGASNARAAIKWWMQLDVDMQKKVSPRRLDEVMLANRNGVDLRYLLPVESHPKKLHQALRHGVPEDTFRNIMRQHDVDKMRKWLNIENNLEAVKRIITKEPEARKFSLPLLDTERLVSLVSNEREVREEVLANPFPYREIIEELARGSQFERLKKRAQVALKMIEDAQNSNDPTSFSLDVKALPSTLTVAQKTYLQNDLEFAADGEYTLYSPPGNASPFSGNFETEVGRLVHFCNLSVSNTYYRSRLVEQIMPIVTKQNMTKDECLSCLRLLEYYVSHSNPNSIFCNGILHKLINTVLYNLRTADSTVTISELWDTIPHIFYRYFNPNGSNHQNYNKIIADFIIRPKRGASQPKKNEALEGITL